MEQPPGFEEMDGTDKVYRLRKALYGLKHVPRAWYDTLPEFLVKHDFRKGTVDRTMVRINDGKERLLVQIYVDDIIFGSASKDLCEKFSTLMSSEFEMSMMGKLNYFLGFK